MKILFISRAYGEHAGGMERLSYELIQSFSPSAQSIVNQTKPGKSLFATRMQSLLFALSVVPKAIRFSKNADIVHIGDPVLSFVGWCIMRIRHIPVVITVHGLDISYDNFLYQFYLRLFFKSFAQYIAISKYAQKLLLHHGVRSNVIVIPPGVRDTLYSERYNRNDLSKLLYRNVSGRVILATAGRLIARKGHAWFIKNVMTKLPRIALYVIAGDGPERSNIAAHIKSLKLEDRVIMLGRISHENKKILFNTIDAFIQPNIPVAGDVEGFGIAPIEAALCGRPVFASSVDGIPSAIHEGKNGTLLSPKETTAWVNAILKFMQHPISNEPSGKVARAYTIENFSWEKITQEYTKVFERLVHKYFFQKQQ